MNIIEIRETNDVNEANELLKEKWVLIQTLKKSDGPSEYSVYVLGLTAMEKLMQDSGTNKIDFGF